MAEFRRSCMCTDRQPPGWVLSGRGARESPVRAHVLPDPLLGGSGGPQAEGDPGRPRRGPERRALLLVLGCWSAGCNARPAATPTARTSRAVHVLLSVWVCLVYGLRHARSHVSVGSVSQVATGFCSEGGERGLCRCLEVGEGGLTVS